MPIYAYSEAMLANFTDILHDMDFDLPSEDVRPSDGRLKFIFTDQYGHLRDDAVSEFHLTIHAVEEFHIEGDRNTRGGEAMFNKFKYKPRENSLAMYTCEGVLVKIRISRLHLELNQVA